MGQSPKSSGHSSILRPSAHRVFKPLADPARYTGAYGGRGSGKCGLYIENATFNLTAGSITGQKWGTFLNGTINTNTGNPNGGQAG